MKAIVIDDEKHSIETTRMMLAEVAPFVEIIGEATSASEGIKIIERLCPDFILLDINMPVMSGLEMLTHIEDYKGEIVFLTAYDQHAIEAFKKGAIHYLLKPLDPDDLIEAIERLKQRIVKDKKPSEGNFLTLSTTDGWTVVRKSEIIHCESFKNYTTINLNNGQHTISKSLKEVEAKLPGESFYRVHHSHLINVNYLDKVQKADGGEIILKNNARIPLAKSRKKAFLDWVKINMDLV